MKAILCTADMDAVSTLNLRVDVVERLLREKIVTVNLIVPAPNDQLPIPGVADAAATCVAHSVAVAVEPVFRGRRDWPSYLILRLANADQRLAIDTLLRAGFENREDDVYAFGRMREQLRAELTGQFGGIAP